ncbi:MAG: S-layer homology domain-containing protein [Clostridia bacterium]|nr:S-layer homology domain-containing protein [Clostridia bacterium]
MAILFWLFLKIALKSYSDVGTGAWYRKEIGTWAVDVMKEAVSLQLIRGNTKNELQSASPATRAEAALLIKRLMNIAKIE